MMQPERIKAMFFDLTLKGVSKGGDLGESGEDESFQLCPHDDSLHHWEPYYIYYIHTHTPPASIFATVVF